MGSSTLAVWQEALREIKGRLQDDPNPAALAMVKQADQLILEIGSWTTPEERARFTNAVVDLNRRSLEHASRRPPIP